MRPASADAVRRCPHCATAVDGPADAFCCRGCEAAAALIRGAGLERYYESREKPAPRPSAIGGRWSGTVVEADADGICESSLSIDGLRCASCVWVTEAVLRQLPGVVEATVSYATGRARLRWVAREIDLATLAETIETLGYRPRVGAESRLVDRTLLTRLGVAGFSSANVMLLSAALYAGWVDPMDPAYAELFRWWTLVLATPVALWCASPFYTAAIRGLRRGVLHMDVPIALGVAVLYGHGIVGVLLHVDTYLDSLSMLVTLLLAGRVVESAGRSRSAEAALSLAATVPSTARRRTPSGVEWVPSDELEPGDVVDVGAGEELPADGVVAWGRGRVQRALLTGESRPVPVDLEDEVWAGTILTDGAIAVRVTVPAESSVVQEMAAALDTAAGGEVGVDPTDRLAPWFTGLTLAAAAGTWLAWTFAAGGGALEPTVAVLVVACPCALALARPLVGMAGLGAAARRGVLFRSPRALLAAANVDLVVLDKTGTVTEGDLRVLDASDEALRVASGLERFSGHPRAEAIVREAVRRAVPIPVGAEVVETSGVGIRGWVDDELWEIRSAGADVVALLGPGGRGAQITFGDRLRDDATATVERIEGLGVETVLLSGDTAAPTDEIARRLGGIDSEASRSPAEKAEEIGRWRRAGRTVLFAGDGLNDGPALAASDVAVAMGGGAASAVLAADAVVVDDRLAPVEAALRVGRVSQRMVRRSRRGSVIYNVLAVAAAGAGWVNPLVAAVLMPLSSGVVLAHAQRVEAIVRRDDP